MKLVIVSFVLAVCFAVSFAIPQYENCDEKFSLTEFNGSNCVKITCHGRHSISAVPCAPYICGEGQRIGYKQEDPTKVYPECCGGPICKQME